MSLRLGRFNPIKSLIAAGGDHIKCMDNEDVIPFRVPFAQLHRLPSVLSTHGFAIVPDVLDAATCKEYEGFWGEDLASIIDVSKSKSSLVNALLSAPESLPFSWPMDIGILGPKYATLYGLPQGRLPWAVRLNRRVQAVYSELYGDQPLCVGMDNVFFDTRISSEDDDRVRHSIVWPHVDHLRSKKPEGDWWVVQGIVHIWSVGADTSSTVIWPGSHQLYDTLIDTSESKKSHHTKMRTEFAAEFTLAARRIPVPQGGMLLWDSCTVHAGWPLGPRLAVPVCFEPKSRRDDAALQRKVDVVRRGTVTTHWASLGHEHPMLTRPVRKGDEELLVLQHVAHHHCKGHDGNIRSEIVQLL